MKLAGVFLIGIAWSYCATRVVWSIATSQALYAMLWDIIALSLAAWPLHVWAKTRHDFRILLADILGSALGTFLAVHYGW